MSIEATKLELIQILLQTQNEHLLSKLKEVFDEEQIDWWFEMSKEEQEEIKTGLDQADKSNFIANETVMKRFDKWH
ncbi:hypothetical protein LX77_02875 [Gelidibacter algens]|uniref:Addiction module component n=1 Tax=Gelidibacter algens TaxID=49280 RepID=A0A1A7R2P0_9FLAO|nr:hypothetical protein [Gelidibacter algens]OBX25773.1 hypothetical protein A9996_08485 [Gelidibacter algens]RAJ21121.1 hypothetical protein LX77_02875 [Gelidibacter algens]